MSFLVSKLQPKLKPRLPAIGGTGAGVLGPCSTYVLAYYRFTRVMQGEDGAWLEEGEWDEDDEWGTVLFQDLSGNGLHATVIPADGLIIKLPEDAGLIAADTANVFFDGDGAAKEVDLETVDANAFVRVGTKGLVLLSAAQTGACLEKTDKWVQAYPYPPSLLLLWNAKDGLEFEKGNDSWDYGYAGNQYDSDGVSVGAVPAIHTDSAGNLKGVWGGPAYKNEITNPLCVGASVGVAPTDWTAVGTSNGITRTVSAVGDGWVEYTWSGTATSNAYMGVGFGPAVAAIAGQTWTYTCAAEIVSGAVPTGGNSNLTVAEKKADGSSVAWQTAAFSAGRITKTLTHADTASLNPYVDCQIPSGQTVNLTIRISKPQLVQSPYVFPFVAPPAGTTGAVSVVSAAGTSSDNGLYLPLTTALTEAFGGDGVNPATMTLAALVTMGVSSAELMDGAFRNVLTAKDIGSALSTLFYGKFGSGELRTAISYDGTSYSGIIGDAYSSNEVHLKLLQTKADGSQFRAGYRRYNADMTAIDASINWSSWVNLDGSFNPGAALRWFYDNALPIWARHLQIWNKGAVTDAEILEYVERA